MPARAVATQPPKRVRVVTNESTINAVDLSGKTCLVTGATSGLGKATATALAKRGATEVLGCRNPTGAGEKIAGEIRAEVGCAEERVIVGPPLDLDSNASVKSFAAGFSTTHPRLHLLVDNAGTNFLPKKFSPEGVGRIAQINFLGPAMLTRLLAGDTTTRTVHAHAHLRLRRPRPRPPTTTFHSNPRTLVLALRRLVIYCCFKPLTTNVCACVCVHHVTLRVCTSSAV